MESDSMAFLCESCLNFKSSGSIVPDVHCLILRTGDYKLFTNTYIKACDLLLVKLSLDIVKCSFKRWKFTGSTINLTCDHLTKVCYDVDLIFFWVYCKRLDWVWRSNMSWFIFYVENTFITVFLKWCTVVHSRASVNPETIFLSDQKAFFKSGYLLNRFAHRWIKYEGPILTVVITHYHLSIVSANKDVACFLRPGMASEGMWNLATLFDVINLSMCSRNNMVLVFFKVFESVVWACKEELTTFNVARVPRDLKATTIWVYLSRYSNRTRAQKSALIPIPEQNLPIWGPSQSDKNLLLSNAKCTTNELLWFVLIHLINCIWKSLPFLGAYYFKNSDKTFFILNVAFAYTNVASTVWKCDMSDSLSTFSSYLKDYGTF